MEQALEFIAADAEKKNNRVINEFKNGEIQVLQGRYGPYVKSGKVNARIPKNIKPETLTESDCEKLVEDTLKKKKK